MAERYRDGEFNMLQSNTRALEMRICAAELGHAEAFEMIGSFYYKVGLVVEQDTSKALEYWKVAAKKGCIQAHEQLARFHGRNRKFHECVQHWKVAANTGSQESMDALLKLYKLNELSKEELTQTLRAFQTSSNAMKNKDRDDYVKFLRRENLID